MLMCSNSPIVCTDPLSGQCAGATDSTKPPPSRFTTPVLGCTVLRLAWLERVPAKKSAEAQAHLQRCHHRDGRQEAAGSEANDVSSSECEHAV